MLAEADEPVDPGAQAVLFYLYAHDLQGLHRREFRVDPRTATASW
jgi:hypothetical protein